ncbi:hypothetical protein [Cryptosporidium hominis TU502]|uniref:hypothetical protein n=1 Tax=Cryptosporidium hominis (strain TU502) TaxID=353151 RepID=UPI00004534D9|nr:hypothetical protein [Cryptosporidium hominis TU502]
MTHIKPKITGMIIETSNQAGNNSPMSLEDPDEPSPSPINPITLKHTLRLASRVSISNNAKVSQKNLVDAFILIIKMIKLLD